jgi:hypothetical protein
MPHGIGGNVIAMTIGGLPINFKLQGWRVRPFYDTIDDTCPGDLSHSRFATFADFEVEFHGYIPDQPARYILSANEAALGSEMTFELKEKISDTNPVFEATGLASELEIDAMDKDRPIGCRGRFMCSTGAQVTPGWDTTPTA